MKLSPRHWTFLGLFAVVFVSMMMRVDMITEPSEDSLKMFNYIDSLPSGSVLLVSFDHEASSLPEIKPIGLALLRHANAKGHKLIGVSLLAEGTLIGYRLMEETAKEFGREYGKDYVFLGFRPQVQAAILSMGESIPMTYPQDYPGNKYEDLEMLKGIENYDDVAAVLSIADGSLTTHWMEYGGRFNLKVIAGVAASMVTTYDPYLSSGQMEAMIGGLRGAAEYEQLIGQRGGGARGMLAQSNAHIYIVLLVALGNVAYFRSRRKGGKA